jgi:hypothetical protein
MPMNFFDLVVDYKGSKDNDLGPFTENVLVRTVKNPLFHIEEEVYLTPLQQSLNEFATNLGKSMGGSKTDTLKKNQSKLVVCQNLEKLAVELCRQANGDREKLATTGFVLSKVPEKRKAPSAPTGFKVAIGEKSGELAFTVDACEVTLMYYFFCTPVPVEENDIQKWKWISSPKRKATMVGLTRGTEYECTCAYQAPDGTFVYGQKIRVIAN